MDVVVGLAIMALIVATPLGIAKWRRWEGAKVLGQIATQIGGRLVSYRELRCKRHGYELQFFRDRNTDRSTVTIPLPPGYPLSIDVRRRSVFKKGVPTLELDDVHFVDAYEVEAAPAAVVARLLDEPVRSFLLEHRECVLVTQGGRLQLSSNALQGASAVEAIELVAGIVGRMRDVFAKLAAEAESIALEDDASPYRPVAIDAGPDLASEQAAEVENLQRAQARAIRAQTIQTIVLVVAGFTVLAAIRLLNRH